MTLREFVTAVPGFASLSHQDRIVYFAWWLHAHNDKERFDQAAVRKCHEDLHLTVPNLSQEFTRLQAKKRILKDGSGFRLEHKDRAKLDAKYGQHETTIAVSKLLKDLATKVSDEAERLFLSEAIKCYNARAPRAAIVMVWNLAYDHLLNWVLADQARVDAFNSKITARVGARKGTGLVMAKREDFEELKEQEVLDIIGNAGILRSGNTKKVLDTYLTRRNLAAHPSLLEIELPAADDMITSLAKNVVLAQL
jgi:hypothetical protein